MEAAAEPSDDARMRWIQDTTRRMESRVRGLRIIHRATVLLGLVASFIATLFATIVAKKGMLGPFDWSQACWIIAGLTGITTLSTGLQSGLDIRTNMAKSSSCLGRLRALDLAASIGTRSPSEISKECEEIAREYSDVLV
jgi:hypothetical protein